MAKGGAAAGDEPAAEYERRRRERIRENQARLEALGLPSLASSLRADDAQGKREDDHGDAKARKRRSSGDADEEYMPSDDGPSSRGESEEEEEERKERSGKGSASGAKQRSNKKGKNTSILIEGRARKKLFDKGFNEDLDFRDEDASLAQAIALSLGEPSYLDAVPSAHTQKLLKTTPTEGVDGKGDILASGGRGKRKKESVKRVQVTEDEAVAYFFSFDESGKGGITPKDLQRMAIAHDFCWSDKEMADMVYLFDADGDGKLSFDEFRNIISRCNMLMQADP